MNLVVFDDPLRARNGRRLQHVDGHQSQRLPPRLIPLRILPLYHDDLPPVSDQLDEGNSTRSPYGLQTPCKQQPFGV